MTIPFVPIFITYQNPVLYYLILSGRYQRTTACLKLRSGYEFIIRPSQGDLYIVNELFIHHQYDAVIPHLNPSRSIVIDIGAHIGTSSILMSPFAKHVYAYEPERSNYSLLKQNIRLNACRNITPLQCGIAANSGPAIMQVAANPAGNSIVAAKTLSNHTQKISCRNLSQEIKRQNIDVVDVLKIDCEGMEYDILTSLSAQTFRKIKHIILEYHDWNQTHHHSELINILTGNNFQIQTITPLTPATGIIFMSNQNALAS